MLDGDGHEDESREEGGGRGGELLEDAWVSVANAGVETGWVGGRVCYFFSEERGVWQRCSPG